MSIELSEVQWEKILKGMEEVIAVSVLLENDLGTQKDFLSANAVCVIKEISCDIRDMFILMEKSANSRARVIGRNGTGKRLLFHRGRKGKHMKRKRNLENGGKEYVHDKGSGIKDNVGKQGNRV